MESGNGKGLRTELAVLCGILLGGAKNIANAVKNPPTLEEANWSPQDQLDETEAQKRMRDTPLRDRLTGAEDHIVPSRWLPPAKGTIPHVCIFSYWINVLWAIPIGAALLVVVIAIAQELRTVPAVQAFVRAYPGQVDAGVYTGFPLWLRLIHFFNLFMMFFIMRSGIQILADHPRLYFNRSCIPGTEWFRFRGDVPLDRVWTSKDDSVRCRDGWAFRGCGIQSGWRASGTFSSICFG